MSTPNYIIDVFHYNVGVGDTSLILVRDTNSTVPVVKAVLIDGSKLAWNKRIWPWIQNLQQSSTFGKFTLSAIIVTHYDTDHLKGIVEMLDQVRKSDVAEEQAKARNPAYTRPNNSILNLFPNNASFFEMTRIYDVGVYLTSVDIDTEAPSKGGWYNKYIGLVGSQIPVNVNRIIGQGKKRRIVSISAPGNDANVNVSKYVRRAITTDEVMIMSSATIAPPIYLGRELIWGDSDGSNGSPSIIGDISQPFATGIMDLRKANNIPQRPGLFCVAMNYACLRIDNTRPDQAGYQSQTSVTAKNQRSIVCVLTNSQGQIIEYLGGDAENFVEERFANWKLDPANTNKDDMVNMMKFSHHGAEESTPLRLLKALNPKYGFFSAGNEYCHPRWEKISDWSVLVENIQSLMFSSYPYYLDQLYKDTAGLVVYNKLISGTDSDWQKFNDASRVKYSRRAQQYVNTYAVDATSADAYTKNFYNKVQQQLVTFATDYRVSLGFAGDKAPAADLDYIDELLVDTQANVRLRSIVPNLGTPTSSYMSDSGGTALHSQPPMIQNYHISFNPSTTTNYSIITSTLPIGGANQITDSVTAMALTNDTLSPSMLVAFNNLTLSTLTITSTSFVSSGSASGFNKFVQALPYGTLILSSWSPANSNQWGGSGVVGGTLGTWFAEFGLTNVGMTLASTSTSGSTTPVITLVTITTATLTFNNRKVYLSNKTNALRISTGNSEETQGDVVLTLSVDPNLNTSSSIGMMDSLLSLGYFFGKHVTFLGATLSLDLQGTLGAATFVFNPFRAYMTELFFPISIVGAQTVISGVLQTSNPTLNLKIVRMYISGTSVQIQRSLMISSGIIINPGSSQISLNASIAVTDDLFATLQISTGGSLAVINALPGMRAYSPDPSTLVSGINYGGFILQVDLSQWTNPVITYLELTVSGTISILNGLNITASAMFPSFALTGSISTTYNMQSLLGTAVSLPPSWIASPTLAQLSFYLDQNLNYQISGNIANLLKVNIGSLVLTFSQISVDIYGQGATIQDVLISLDLSLDLYGEDLTSFGGDDTAITNLTGGYTSEGWFVSGWFSHLNLQNLASIFTGNTAARLLSVLPTIELVDTQFCYNITTSSLSVSSMVLVDNAVFTFSYQYTSITANFLNLNLSSATGDLNLGTLLNTIGLSDIPSFIAHMNIPFASLDIDYDFTNGVLTLTTLNTAKTFVIVLSRYLNASNKAQYFLRVMITGVSGFPLVGNITLPLDSFFLVYATDTSDANGWTSGTSPPPPPGISYTTFTTTLQLQDEPDPTSYNALSQMYTSNPSFRISGLQAFILGNGQVGLIGPLGASIPPSTYTGQNTQSSAPVDPSTGNSVSLSAGQVGDGGTPGGPPSSNTPATWIKVQKTLGPVFVNRIGFSIGSTVWILLDATLNFGPLIINLEGLRIGFQISPLQFEPQFALDGLGINYSSGNLAIQGTLVKVNPSPAGYVDLFQGGVTITYKPYTITALGSYGRALNPNGDGDIVTFFIFGRVKAPFGGPPEAYVTGLAAGFGYNQTLNLPDLDQVDQFPLVQGSIDLTALSDDPLTTLKALFNTGPSPDLAWITPNFNNGKWLAAGLDFTTYNLIFTRALLTVGFGDMLEIAVLGRSVFSLPPGPPSVPKYIYIELGIRALIQPDLGFWGVSAVLSPNSYIMGPFCRITGGFAWYNWFGNNPHAGDFVLTVGGYHPQFKVPSHYPVVPRLGYGWQYSNNISIRGEAYFALTPNCVMLGGAYNLNFQMGDLSAWFNAKANAIIYWNPFWFDVDVGVRIGAKYHVDCFFFSFDISVEVGAELEIWGPPIGGRVDIDLGPFGFTVRFGQDKNPVNNYLRWSGFVKTLPQNPQNPMNTMLIDGVQDYTQYFKVMASQGLIASNTTSSSPIWQVRGQNFEFRVEFAFPATYVTFSGSNGVLYFLYGTTSNYSIRPMNIQASSLSQTTKTGYQTLYQISITGGASSNTWQIKNAASIPGRSWTPPTQDVLTKVGVSTTTMSTKSLSGLEISSLPASIWGDPLDVGSALNGGKPTVDHATAINLIVPPATTTSSVASSVSINSLLTSAISTPLLSPNTQNVPDPYWPTLPSIAPTQTNPGVIGQIKGTLQDTYITASRQNLANLLNTNLANQGRTLRYTAGTLNVLQSYVEVLYPDPPLTLAAGRDSGGYQIPSSGNPAVMISALSVGYSSTTGNTLCQFVLSGASVNQKLNLTYSIYLNQSLVVAPTATNGGQVTIDQNLGFVYNPWATYTIVVVDSSDNVVEASWPLNFE